MSSKVRAVRETGGGLAALDGAASRPGGLPAERRCVLFCLGRVELMEVGKVCSQPCIFFHDAVLSTCRHRATCRFIIRLVRVVEHVDVVIVVGLGLVKAVWVTCLPRLGTSFGDPGFVLLNAMALKPLEMKRLPTLGTQEWFDRPGAHHR